MTARAGSWCHVHGAGTSAAEDDSDDSEDESDTVYT